jgi:hypothetical protein
VTAVLLKDHKPVRHHRAEVSPVLDAIVHKCLMFEPGERYAGAEALAQDLDSYLNDRPTVVRPPSLAVRAWNTARNLQTSTVVAWCLALLVLTIIGATFFNKKQESQPEKVFVTATEARKAYFDECRKKLQAGKPVTLIGPEGSEPPEHVDWPLKSYSFNKPPAPPGAAQLIAGEDGLAILLDDPGIDSYVLRGEFQQITSGLPTKQDIGYRIGLAFGYQELKTKFGSPTKAFFTLRYQEGDKEVFANGTTNAELYSINHVYEKNGNRNDRMDKNNIGRIPFRPTASVPGDWRQMEVLVLPDNFNAKMGDVGGKVENLVVNDGKGDPVAFWLDDIHHGTGRKPGDISSPVPDATWKPRGGLGIWCYQAALLARNVEIIPLKDDPNK